LQTTGTSEKAARKPLSQKLINFRKEYGIKMQQSTHIQTTEAAIIHHFRDAGDDLSAETKVLDAAIRTIVIEGRKVTT